jgi:urease accessory protein
MSTEPPGGTADDAALYRLMAWLSPAYPVGAFSYSHGLEHAVEAGLVHDAESAEEWLRDIVRFGGARNDGVFLVCAHRAAARADRAVLCEVAELAAAHVPSAELALETTAQGAAFIRTTGDAWACDALAWLVEDWPGPYAYPVAVGVAAAGHGIAAAPALLAYLSAFAANLVSAAVRLVPLGQSDGQRIVAALEPTVAESAAALVEATLDDLGSATVMVDYASMQHETQYTRLFRS